MHNALKRRFLSEEEYLAAELTRTDKHEFVYLIRRTANLVLQVGVEHGSAQAFEIGCSG